MTNKENELKGVAKLREQFFEIRKQIKPSPELVEIFKKKPAKDQPVAADDEFEKKIAKPRDPEMGP